MRDQMSVYDFVGGDEVFRRLVDVFYQRIENDPELRAMFPDDLEPGKEYQFLFLTQYFGGPQRYADQRGHPRLRMRHQPFPIDSKARKAWFDHMLAAIDAVGIEEPARTIMHDYFERASEFMINRYPVEEPGDHGP
jgi:hemoglobin